MIYYSDKHNKLNPLHTYMVDGVKRVYLGFTHIDGGRDVQYRFKSKGLDLYSNKTAKELDKADIFLIN